MTEKKQKKVPLRNFFLIFYVVGMLFASGWLCVSTFRTQRTVLIDDRDLVMQRRSAVIPVSAEIRDPRWGASEMEDRSRILEISQLMGRISIYFAGPVQDTQTQALEGKITYIDGTSLSFLLDDVLSYEGGCYGGDNAAFELEALRRMLTEEMYTLKNLESFFSPQHSISIAAKGRGHVLNADSVEQLRQALLSCQLLSDPTDIEYHIRNREVPLCTITVKRFGNISDIITLVVYDGDYVDVYDVTGGNGLVMVLTGDFAEACQKLL